MRIISQDGCEDIPYEKLCVSLDTRNGRTIIGYSVNIENDSYLILGTYNTKERALEVIKEIRKHYNKIKKAEFLGCENEYYVCAFYKMPEE